MKAQKYSGWIILWEVVMVDDDDREMVIARFKDAKNAAVFAIKRMCTVRMALHKPEWNTGTED